MNRTKNVLESTLILCSLLISFVTTEAIAGEITVTGRVNAYFQIQGKNGELYDIEMTPIGDELTRMVGAKVRVTGTVQTVEGSKVLVVTTYEVIEENREMEAPSGKAPVGRSRVGVGTLQSQ